MDFLHRSGEAVCQPNGCGHYFQFGLPQSNRRPIQSSDLGRQIQLAQESLIAAVVSQSAAQQLASQLKSHSGVAVPMGLLQPAHRLIDFAAIRMTFRDPKGLVGVLLGQFTQGVRAPAAKRWICGRDGCEAALSIGNSLRPARTERAIRARLEVRI